MSAQKYSASQHLVEALLSWVKSCEIAIPEIHRPLLWDATKVRDQMESLGQVSQSDTSLAQPTCLLSLIATCRTMARSPAGMTSSQPGTNCLLEDSAASQPERFEAFLVERRRLMAQEIKQYTGACESRLQAYRAL